MKVAIIGAGITGLYLAWKLAEKREEVTVFEKRGIIGKQVCSGLVSERILDFIPESKKLIQNQIDYCLIHWVAAGWRPKQTLKIKFRKKFFVINHFELDNLVAKFAEKAGAKIILNNPINSLPNEFDCIIGCDGPMSQIRKILGLPDPEFKLAIQGFSSEENLAPFVETWPTKSESIDDYAKHGFIWKIPRGNKTEYGIIEKPEQAKKLFDDFLKKNKLHLKKIKSALIGQGLVIPSGPKITLCGEAAGLTKPWSGGGIIWSLMAADILLKNFPDFLKYKKQLKKFFLPNIIFSKMAKKIIYLLGFNFPWLLPKNYKIEGDFLI